MSTKTTMEKAVKKADKKTVEKAVEKTVEKTGGDFALSNHVQDTVK
jgi:predicted SpoU family rRNA methylase